MSLLIQNTVILVENFNDEIRSDLYTKGIDNSFTASDSIRIEAGLYRVTSYGVDYLYFLDKGRGPGKFPPPESLRQWVNSKPVPVAPYVIGRKIAREGTEIFKNPSKGIQLEEKRSRLLAELREKAPEWVKNDLLNKIKIANKNIK